MSFEIKATKHFLGQLAELSDSAKQLVDQKIDLIAQNPYRYKKLRSKQLSKVFRVRLNLDGQEKRLVYTVLEPNIILVVLLDRKSDYKDLEKYLKKLL